MQCGASIELISYTLLDKFVYDLVWILQHSREKIWEFDREAWGLGLPSSSLCFFVGTHFLLAEAVDFQPSGVWQSSTVSSALTVLPIKGAGPPSGQNMG